MKFHPPLIGGRLIRRYKRFLADVILDSGEAVTAHCPNTGSMLGCQDPGSRVWLSRSDNPRRKYCYTWELVETAEGTKVGIHTGRTNALVEEAIRSGAVRELPGYGEIRREVRYGQERSRVDLLLSGDPERSACYVEIKNVTAAVDSGVALFPDAVSARGSKHLRELMAMAAQGDRAVIFFCVQRGDVREVRPADAIDPEYGATLRQALACGVEALAYRARVGPRGIELTTPVPVVCP